MMPLAWLISAVVLSLKTMNSIPGKKVAASLCASVLWLFSEAALFAANEAPPASDSLANIADAAYARTYQTKIIEGWTVLLDDRLFHENKAAAEKAVQLLGIQLREIVRAVPASAVEKLREVKLWISPEYPGIQPRAEYHPDRKWLEANERNPAMAKGIEFTNVRIFEAETIRMPCLVLHELAHGYHDRVLGFDHPEIKAAFERAKTGKSYDAVERWHGNGRPNTVERAYAMTNAQEYFAETTEAFFGRNDFFPFTRPELQTSDPEMAKLLERLWNTGTPALP